MQIRAEPKKLAPPICKYSQILYQFLTFTQNLKQSLIFIRFVLLALAVSIISQFIYTMHSFLLHMCSGSGTSSYFKRIFIVLKLLSAYFYHQFFIFDHNYSEYISKAEDNYYLTPQILANSSQLSIHSADSDISTPLFSIAVFNISIA